MPRRKFTPEFKIQVVKEVMETDNASAVAQRHELHLSVLNRWINAYKANGPEAFHSKNTSDKGDTLLQQRKQLEKENAKLKKLLAEKDLQIAILVELLKKVDTTN